MGVITNPIPRTAITFAERCAIERLARCTFTPGSAHKRFARDMASMLDSRATISYPKPAITDGQRDQLWRLVYRYRRQILQQESLKDAGLRLAVTDHTVTGSQPRTNLVLQLGWKTHIKELVSLAQQYEQVMGLRRRVAALRREAAQV